MPVTAKLSKLFYERLGEQIANELVDWFNAVDATYRTDLKDLNDANFARFDAKLEQRLAQFESKLEQRLAQLESKLDQRLVQLEANWNTRFSHLELTLERALRDHIKWMFVAWTALLIPIIGLWFR
jgi:hypothetical protein